MGKFYKIADITLKILAFIVLFWIGYETYLANCIYLD